MQIYLPRFGSVIAGQGGVLAAIMRGPIVNGEEQDPYALLDTGIEFESEWGKYGKLIDGATSRVDGKANTDAMLRAGCTAATRLAEMESEGHKDLFIAAIGQMNAAAANVPERFDPKGVQWTSTQASRNFAFVQDFATGLSYWYGKGNEFRVRAFRSIPLHLLNP